MPPEETSAQFYRDRRDALNPADGSRWYLFIKELRVSHSCDLDEAHRIALADPAWRRWLERQINTNATCRKSALRHIRDSGDSALLEEAGNTLKIR